MVCLPCFARIEAEPIVAAMDQLLHSLHELLLAKARGKLAYKDLGLRRGHATTCSDQRSLVLPLWT